jgi:hypothetical protein
MPVKLERKLRRQANADPDIKDKDAYVYGTLRKTGWKPSTQKKNKKKELSALLDRVIQFQQDTEDSTATILQPFQGATTHESKIDQLEFPAGLSPAAALRLPLPQLMAYLNRRNYLQQVYPA